MVDLVCERRVADITEADAFVPHFGGSVATVAVVAARAGAHVALAGGAGDDDWGLWLRRRLKDEGVDLRLFRLAPDRRTQVAFVTVSGDGGPHHLIYGGAIAPVLAALSDHLEAAVGDSAALFIGSGTLAGKDERAVTMRARELALDRGLPVVFDASIRLKRWSSRSDAAASTNACVPRALLVRASSADAELMTGEDDPERAALALLKAGAKMVVLTLGAGAAILRGELPAEASAVPVQIISTLGAEDVLTGTILARLAASGFYPPSVAAALGDAVAASARASERWAALD
jgi:fructokinase